MISIANRARRLALAATLAASVVSVSAVQAFAEPVDPGVRCAAQTGPGAYEFFLPGERAVDKDGNKWVCGPDGKWFRDYSALVVSNPTVNVPPIKLTASLISAPAAVLTR